MFNPKSAALLLCGFAQSHLHLWASVQNTKRGLRKPLPGRPVRRIKRVNDAEDLGTRSGCLCAVRRFALVTGVGGQCWA